MDNDKAEESQHSENLYAYQESEGREDEAPKESNAIRRSIGRGDNPYKLKNSSSINPLQENNTNNNNNPSYDKHFPNYQEKSTEQRLPSMNQRNSEAILRQKHSNDLNEQDSSEQNKNEIKLKSKNLGDSEQSESESENHKKSSYVVTMLLIVLQIVTVVVLALAYKKGDGDPINFDKDSDFGYYFHFMKDVHLMIFIGFGLLYCSLKAHQFSSISLVLFLSIIAFEFSLLWNYFWNNTMRKKIFTNYEQKWSRLKLTMEEITQVDFFSTSAIICLGSLLGKLTLGQYLLAISFETFFAALNHFICYFSIGGIDTGGSIYIFAFGAIFGFCVSFVLSYDNHFRNAIRNNQNNKSDYYSNIISSIGTLFIWIYFPSFNISKIHCAHDKNVMEIMRYRGIINTYMSMIGSTVVSFSMSALLSNQKFKMEHILRSSYVGGVIISGSCTFCPYPWCAMLVGCIGGLISVAFLHLTRKENGVGDQPPVPNNFPCLSDFIQAIKMSDTIGVFYCFGIPGILGGLCNIIFLACLGKKPWNDLNLVDFFYYDRSSSKQAGIQIAVLFITIGFALFSGILIGFIERFFRISERENLFTDRYICQEKNDNNNFSGFKKKTFLSSSENKLNDEENENEGVEIQINNKNNGNE